MAGAARDSGFGGMVSAGDLCARACGARVIAFASTTLAAALILPSCTPIDHEIGVEWAATGGEAGSTSDRPGDCDPTDCVWGFRWFYAVSGRRSQLGRRVATDEQDNVYFAGEFEDAANFPDQTLPVGGARVNAFLGSLTPEGAPRWLLNMGSLNETRIDALSLRAEGPLLAVRYVNPIEVAGLYVPEVSNGALALLAFDTKGQGSWWKILRNAAGGQLEPVNGAALVVKQDASISLAGNHVASLEGDGLGLPAPVEGKPFGFVATFEAGGPLRSLKPTGTQQRWNAAAWLSTGTVLVGEETSEAGGDILLSWLDADGNSLVTHHFGGVGDDAALSVLRADGDITYVAGFVGSSISLGGPAVSHTGLKDIFVASYAANGSHRWSKSFGSMSDDWGVRLQLAPNGDVLLLGMQGDAVSFGTELVGGFSNAFFVARLNHEGAPQSAQAFAMNNGEATDLAVALDGSLYVTGSFDGALRLPGRTVTSNIGTDGFLVKLTAR